MSSSLTVNGRETTLDGVPGSERLLDSIRWRFGLRGTKEGCRTGDCGACTVLVNGESVLSCLTLTHEVAGERLTTIEAIDGEAGGPAVLAAFAQEGAVQCGYCTPGFVMALTSLLTERGRAGRLEEFEEDLQGNLCRCTGYVAIRRAAQLVREGAP
ncbi:MAG: (2Fe-2S)-binding protein [Thermoplasmata archaeon]